MDLDTKRADGVLEVAAMMIVVDSEAEALSYGLRGLRILNERMRCLQLSDGHEVKEWCSG